MDRGAGGGVGVGVVVVGLVVVVVVVGIKCRVQTSRAGSWQHPHSPTGATETRVRLGRCWGGRRAQRDTQGGAREMGLRCPGRPGLVLRQFETVSSGQVWLEALGWWSLRCGMARVDDGCLTRRSVVRGMRWGTRSRRPTFFFSSSAAAAARDRDRQKGATVGASARRARNRREATHPLR